MELSYIFASSIRAEFAVAKRGRPPCMQRSGRDSEFMQSGRANEPADVHSIQISDGTPENTFFLDSSDQLKKWLSRHHSVTDLYGFVALPDLASVSVWLPKGSVKISTRWQPDMGQNKIWKLRGPHVGYPYDSAEPRHPQTSPSR